jgi:predicted amidohydrolase
MSCSYTPPATMLCIFFAIGIVRGEGPPASMRPQGQASQQLKVAVAQPLVLPGNVKQNIHNMEPLVAKAANRGAELIVFSECGITGYDLKGVAARAAISLDDGALKAVADLARKHNIVIVAGFHERRGDKLHNTAAVFYPDGQRVVQRKYNILPPEKNVAPIAPAERKRTFFTVKGFRFAILICSDAGTPGIYEELAAAGTQAIIVITAGGGSASLGTHQDALADPVRRKNYAEQAVQCLSSEAIDQCLRLRCAQIACNQAGWNAGTGYFHPGGSSIIDRTGEVKAIIPPRFVFEHLRPDLAVGFVTR